MTDSTSRYSNVGTAIWRSARGETVHYRQRRFLPDPSSMQVLDRVVVQSGQRIDQIAALQYGDPLQAWRIADANAAMEPTDLTTLPGTTLIVPVPKA